MSEAAGAIRLGDGGVRLAVIATPRSGGTWLRLLLASLYEVQAAEWPTPGRGSESLPSEGVVHMHSRLDEGLRSSLEEAGFVTIVLARHPLDVLVSILHFVAHDSGTLAWLGTGDSGESAIRDASPTSAAFLEYATGPRARALLSVSAEWAPVAAHVLRYEDLVSSTARVLGDLARSLGVPPRAAAERAVAENTLDAMRARFSQDYHFWQGRPGLWRALLPAPIAQEIEAAHTEIFQRLGYECDADPDLAMKNAEQNWSRLERDGLKRAEALNRDKATRLQQQLVEANATLAEQQALLIELDAKARTREQALEAAHAKLKSMDAATRQQQALLIELDAKARIREQALEAAHAQLKAMDDAARQREATIEELQRQVGVDSAQALHDLASPER